MLGLGSRQRDDYTVLYSLVELVRFKKLHSVAQFPSPGTVEESWQELKTHRESNLVLRQNVIRTENGAPPAANP
jgi:hypothetical protein